MDPILIFAVLGIGLLFFMSSRTRKQQRAQQDFRSSLEPGQEVMTASGLFGTVVEIDEEHDIVVLESTPGGSQTRWLRAAIAKRIDEPAVDDEVTDGDEVEGEDAAVNATSDAPIELRKDADATEFAVPDDLSGLDDDGKDDKTK